MGSPHATNRRLSRCFNVADLRLLAKKRLPKGIFEYIDLGTEDGIALRDNRQAFERLRLTTRFLVDLRERDFGTEVFGRRLEIPLGIAPTGIAGLCWYDAEVALAEAARSAGIPFTLAQPALTPMERIADVGGQIWFQIYMWAEVDHCYSMIERAHGLGYEALVITIDSGLGRIREHNERNGFSFPFKPNVRATASLLRRPGWLTTMLLRTLATSGLPANANYPPEYQRFISRQDSPRPHRHEGMQWTEVGRIREMWTRTLIVKGILNAGDAVRAVEQGADGIVVSNHGGRSMDSAIATIDVLPEIVEAVGDKTTVILDSGIRRGSDIVKALARGADMVMVGRAALYGVAAGGRAGAEMAIEVLRNEFEKTMGYVGCRTIAEVDPDVFAT